MKVFVQKVVLTIEKYQLFSRGSRVLVGVSGGADSVALLLALVDLRLKFPLELLVAHFNHRLRGEESDKDEEFVRKLCRDLEIRFEVEHAETGWWRDGNTNLEESARRQRYDFLSRLALKEGCIVSTGHTLNDQAETFLMKMIRGAGPTGLAGIYPRRLHQVNSLQESSRVVVVRPLLYHTRDEVVQYLSEKGQNCRIDKTNQDLNFDRNWIRHELVPLLKNKLNIRLLESLSRSANLFREIGDFLRTEGKKGFNQCEMSTTKAIRLNLTSVGKLPSILRKEVIREAIRKCKGDLKSITLRHVESVLELNQSSSGKEVHLPGGLRVKREYETLYFSADSPSKTFCYELTVPGEVYVREVGKYVVARKPTLRGKSHRKGIWIKLPMSSMKVRNWRPGDRFELPSSSKKLKELFQKERIPKSRRDNLLILEVDNQIVWLEEFSTNFNYQIPDDRVRTVQIEIFDKNFR